MMKTPDEIKKGLECCYNSYPASICNKCPYNDDPDVCVRWLEHDTYEYIQQLEHYIGELAEYAAQLEEEQPKWISVEDRLPDAGEKVMICGVKNGMQVGAFRGLSHPSENRKWWWKKNTVIEVTHWMPIPSTEGLE